MHDLYRRKSDPFNGEGGIGDGMDIYSGYARITFVGKNIGILLFELCNYLFPGIHRHIGFLLEIECPNIVEACRMVFVLMGEKQCI